MGVKHRIDLHFSKKKGGILLAIGFFIILCGVILTLSPPMYTTTEVTDQRIYDINNVHESITVKDSRLYDEGERVTNGPQYFTNIHPELNIQFSTNVNEYEELEIQDTTYTIQVISNRGNYIIWSEDKKISDINWGEQVTDSSIKIDIFALQSEINEINNEIPNSANIVVDFESTYVFTTEQDGIVSLTSSPQLTFNHPQSYTVESDEVRESFESTEEIEKPQPSQSFIIQDYPFGWYGILVILAGIIVSVVGSYVLHGGLYSSRTYNERLFEYHKNKYDEWITYGRPMSDPEFESGEKLKLDTLEGLIDVAIDTDKRVIYSKDMARFYIFSDGTLYTYVPPSLADKETLEFGFF